MYTMFAPHASSIPVENIEDDYDSDAYLITPKAPRGKRSDLTEKDLDEFKKSPFHQLLSQDTD
jgi:hypothetical protein